MVLTLLLYSLYFFALVCFLSFARIIFNRLLIFLFRCNALCVCVVVTFLLFLYFSAYSSLLLHPFCGWEQLRCTMWEIAKSKKINFLFSFKSRKSKALYCNDLLFFIAKIYRIVSWRFFIFVLWIFIKRNIKFHFKKTSFVVFSFEGFKLDWLRWVRLCFVSAQCVLRQPHTTRCKIRMKFHFVWSALFLLDEAGFFVTTSCYGEFVACCGSWQTCCQGIKGDMMTESMVNILFFVVVELVTAYSLVLEHVWLRKLISHNEQWFQIGV